MIQAVFPTLHVGKDVILGILPFFHIAGSFVTFHSSRGEAENTKYRGCAFASFSNYGWVAGRDHATL